MGAMPNHSEWIEECHCKAKDYYNKNSPCFSSWGAREEIKFVGDISKYLDILKNLNDNGICNVIYVVYFYGNTIILKHENTEKNVYDNLQS